MSDADPNPADALADFDFDASTDQAWDSFAARLADVLSVMDADATLRIGALEGAHEGAAPFVLFTCREGGRLDAVASDSSHTDAGFNRSGTQEDPRPLADVTVGVLRDVYGVPHPAFLAPDQLAEILTPAPASEPAAASPFDANDLLAILPRSKADLDAVLASELADLLGYEPMRGRDGDFAIRVGSTMVFVRTTQDAREVLVFAAVVHDVEGRSRAMEVLSDLNTEARWVRFLLIRDRVFVSLSVFAHPFVPAHLHQALDIVSVIGDHIDDELAAKLRGRTTFSDTDDPAGT